MYNPNEVSISNLSQYSEIAFDPDSIAAVVARKMIARAIMTNASSDSTPDEICNILKTMQEQRFKSKEENAAKIHHMVVPTDANSKRSETKKMRTLLRSNTQKLPEIEFQEGKAGDNRFDCSRNINIDEEYDWWKKEITLPKRNPNVSLPEIKKELPPIEESKEELKKEEVNCPTINKNSSASCIFICLLI